MSTTADLGSALAAAGVDVAPWWPAGWELMTPLPDDARIIITPEDESSADWLIGLYSAEGYEHGTEDAAHLYGLGVQLCAQIVDHLVNEHPEGTDYLAWARQRLADLDAEIHGT